MNAIINTALARHPSQQAGKAHSLTHNLKCRPTDHHGDSFMGGAGISQRVISCWWTFGRHPEDESIQSGLAAGRASLRSSPGANAQWNHVKHGALTIGRHINIRERTFYRATRSTKPTTSPSCQAASPHHTEHRDLILQPHQSRMTNKNRFTTSKCIART